MDRQDGGLGRDEAGRKELKKRSSISTDGERLQKVERTEIPGYTHPLEAVPVPRRQSGEDEDAGVARLVWARNLEEGVFLPLVQEHPDAMEYAL